MEVTAFLKKRAKAFNAKWQDLVMADLLAIGYGEHDAYAIAYSENTSLDAKKITALRDRALNSPGFQELRMTRKRAIAKKSAAQIDENGEIELIGAEETAREILKIAQAMPEGSKERGEMFVRYADLIRKNDTQTGDEEEQVQIYLPLKCTMCPAKAAYGAKSKGGGE